MKATVFVAHIRRLDSEIEVVALVNDLLSLFPGATITNSDVHADTQTWLVGKGLAKRDGADVVSQDLESARAKTGRVQAVEIPVAAGNSLWGTVQRTGLLLKGAVSPTAPEISRLKDFLESRGLATKVEVTHRDVPDKLLLVPPYARRAGDHAGGGAPQQQREADATPETATGPEDDEVIDALRLMRVRYPHWRLGQLVCNVASFLSQEAEYAWDMTDSDFVRSVREHLARRAELDRNPDHRAPGF
jgi:hypothetical protein